MTNVATPILVSAPTDYTAAAQAAHPYVFVRVESGEVQTRELYASRTWTFMLDLTGMGLARLNHLDRLHNSLTRAIDGLFDPEEWYVTVDRGAPPQIRVTREVHVGEVKTPAELAAAVARIDFPECPAIRLAEPADIALLLARCVADAIEDARAQADALDARVAAANSGAITTGVVAPWRDHTPAMGVLHPGVFREVRSLPAEALARGGAVRVMWSFQFACDRARWNNLLNSDRFNLFGELAKAVDAVLEGGRCSTTLNSGDPGRVEVTRFVGFEKGTRNPAVIAQRCADAELVTADPDVGPVDAVGVLAAALREVVEAAEKAVADAATAALVGKVRWEMRRLALRRALDRVGVQAKVDALNAEVGVAFAALEGACRAEFAAAGKDGPTAALVRRNPAITPAVLVAAAAEPLSYGDTKFVRAFALVAGEAS